MSTANATLVQVSGASLVIGENRVTGRPNWPVDARPETGAASLDRPLNSSRAGAAESAFRRSDRPGTAYVVRDGADGCMLRCLPAADAHDAATGSHMPSGTSNLQTAGPWPENSVTGCICGATKLAVAKQVPDQPPASAKLLEFGPTVARGRPRVTGASASARCAAASLCRKGGEAEARCGLQACRSDLSSGLCTAAVDKSRTQL